MAAQVVNANVIRIEWFGGSWSATIGPSMELGLFGLGGSPEAALAALMTKMLRSQWPWDSGWTDNLSVFPKRG